MQSINYNVDLHMGDPVLRLLNRLSGRRALVAVAIGVLTYGLTYVGIGIVISLLYEGRSPRNYSSLLDPPDLLLTVLMYLITAPVLWGFYVREAGEFDLVVRRLLASGVFGPDQRMHRDVNAYLR